MHNVLSRLSQTHSTSKAAVCRATRESGGFGRQSLHIGDKYVSVPLKPDFVLRLRDQKPTAPEDQARGGPDTHTPSEPYSGTVLRLAHSGQHLRKIQNVFLSPFPQSVLDPCS